MGPRIDCGFLSSGAAALFIFPEPGLSLNDPERRKREAGGNQPPKRNLFCPAGNFDGADDHDCCRTSKGAISFSG
jgi:hypothetical protein